MSNQKKKNLGQGMKPRGNQPFPEIPENAVSADTGQEEPPQDIIPRVRGGEQTPNNLESVFEASTEGVSVAADNPNSGLSLQQILDNSAELDQEKSEVINLDPSAQMQRHYDEMTATTLERLETRPGHPVPVVSTEVRNQFPTAEDIANHPLMRLEGGKIEPVLIYDTLGQQSDGTFKLVLSVDEGYIESIRQEAENNSMTPEQWCSQQFNFFLESWWSKPKGR